MKTAMARLLRWSALTLAGWLAYVLGRALAAFIQGAFNEFLQKRLAGGLSRTGQCREIIEIGRGQKDLNGQHDLPRLAMRITILLGHGAS